MSIDWSSLWHLGGHGAYVWPGYALAALWIAAEAAWLLKALRRDDGEDA